VFSTRLVKDCLKEMQRQIGQLEKNYLKSKTVSQGSKDKQLRGDSRQTVKTDTDKSNTVRQLK
jgi:hypothetical protein